MNKDTRKKEKESVLVNSMKGEIRRKNLFSITKKKRGKRNIICEIYSLAAT